MNKSASKTAAEAQGKAISAGLGLDSMGDLSSLLNAPVAQANSGGPLLLEIDLIDEDLKQPRTEDNPGFSKESLSDMAASINLRGVKTPISVRANPKAPGRFLINHGARRFRGSKLAGKTVIPAFVDNDYNEADQVVENLQRNELTAREIADFIGREMAKGLKKGEIAKLISKSPAFVSQHVTLLDLPDAIAAAFNTGRVKDVTVVNELVTAFKKKPEDVSSWLAQEDQEITRGAVKLLRDFLEESPGNDLSKPSAPQELKQPVASSVSEAPAKGEQKQRDTEKLKKVVVQVKLSDRPARLVLDRRPLSEGRAWLKFEDDGHEIEADLSEVRLVSIKEG